MSGGTRLGLIAAAIAIAVAAFIALRPADDEDAENTGTTTGEQVPGGPGPPRTRPAPAAERIEVRRGEPVGGVREIRVASGDEVRLVVSADAAEHVHVHGYDLFEDVRPARPARFEFDADIEGIFEIELEDSRTPIAELRVEP